MPACLLSLLCCFLVLSGVVTLPASAEEDTTPNSGNETIEGAVVSSSRDTLVVRGDDDRFHLYTYERGAPRPKTLAEGVRIRVTAGVPDENGTRAASNIVVLNPSSAAQAGATAGPADKGAQAAPVPPEVRNVESEIRREARRWRLGARAGMAFNPELFMFGLHSQMGPIFHPRVQFRPSAEFDFGEVTDLIALNLEGVYRFSASYRSNWTPYVGLGPALIFAHRNLERGRDVDFGNFDYETGFNVLGGMQSRRGTFVELKTSLYSGPAPRLRLIFGYTF
jgi:hypothetical protein